MCQVPIHRKTHKTEAVMNQRILPVAALILLSGCISVSKSVLTYDMPPVDLEQVQVFLPYDELPEYTNIAILSSSRMHLFSTRKQLIEKLRRNAAELGANAIVLAEPARWRYFNMAAELVALGVAVDFAVNGLWGWALGILPQPQPRGEAIAIYIPDMDQHFLPGPVSK